MMETAIKTIVIGLLVSCLGAIVMKLYTHTWPSFSIVVLWFLGGCIGSLLVDGFRAIVGKR